MNFMGEHLIQGIKEAVHPLNEPLYGSFGVSRACLRFVFLFL